MRPWMHSLQHRKAPLEFGDLLAPLLDRINLHVEVPTVSLRELRSGPGEPTALVAERLPRHAGSSRRASEPPPRRGQRRPRGRGRVLPSGEAKQVVAAGVLAVKESAVLPERRRLPRLREKVLPPQARETVVATITTAEQQIMLDRQGCKVDIRDIVRFQSFGG
jgi:hypothetical protein